MKILFVDSNRGLKRHRARRLHIQHFTNRETETTDASSGKISVGVRHVIIRIQFKRFSNLGDVEAPWTRTINVFLPRVF